MYKILLDKNEEISERMIQKTDENGIIHVIPNDPANTDWQAYQAWLALGNEPDPAE